MNETFQSLVGRWLDFAGVKAFEPVDFEVFQVLISSQVFSHEPAFHLLRIKGGGLTKRELFSDLGTVHFHGASLPVILGIDRWIELQLMGDIVDNIFGDLIDISQNKW